MRRVCKVFVLLNLLLSLVTYCFAAPQDTIIGNWEGDIDLCLGLPHVKEQLEMESPEDKEAIVSYLDILHSIIKMEITKDTITIDVGRPEKETANYTVTDSTDNKVYITILEETNDEMILEIVDEDHIIVHEVNGFVVTVAFC